MHRFTPKFALRPAAAIACAAAIVSLSGCAGISGTAVSNSLTTSIPAGSLHGGQQPIQGSHVYVYAANSTGGYGSASTSLITTGQPGVTTDGNGHGYVTTDANGSFKYGGTVTCPSATSQIYIVAIGGNGTGYQNLGNNSALELTAALGSCNTITSSTFTSINEVTTAAMAYALQSFTIDEAHIGSSSTNTTGLVNAFAVVPRLVNNTTGTALATTPGGNGVAPQRTLNTLANIVAPCANSGSSTSQACTQLMSHATVGSSTPTDTFRALLNIASAPGTSTANLYNDALATAPFQPALTAQPIDFSLGITYSPSVTVNKPGAVVIDAGGNIWMANCQSCSSANANDTLVVYGPDGTFLHSYSNSGLHNTQGLAIDSNSTHIYSTNQAVSGSSTHTDDEVTEMTTSNGAFFSSLTDPSTFGTGSLAGIALDNAGNVWMTAPLTSTVVQMDTNLNYINSSPYQSGSLIAPTGVGTDNNGNIWVAGFGIPGSTAGSVGEFDSNGNFLHNYTTSGIDKPLAIAINSTNEIWTVNNGNNTLSKIEASNGANGTGSPYSAIGLYQAAITAIDGTNQVIIPNCRAGCAGSGSTAPDNVLRLSQAGVLNSGSNNGAATPGLNGAGGAAVDASGNVWVSNSVDGKLVEIIGFAAPTIQPIAKASALGKLGQLP